MGAGQNDSANSDRTSVPAAVRETRTPPSPFTISLILLAYYFGGRQFASWFVPSVSSRYEDFPIALGLQMAYGFGGVILAFWLSTSRPISAWLSDCGMRRTKAGFIVHGFTIGVGLQLILRILIWGDIRYGEKASIRSAEMFSVLLMPILEDLVFQGSLYCLYRRRFNVFVSTMFVSLVATSAHASNAGSSVAWIGLLLLTEAVFCLYREYTGAIWATSTCHISSNLVALFAKW